MNYVYKMKNTEVIHSFIHTTNIYWVPATTLHIGKIMVEKEST